MQIYAKPDKDTKLRFLCYKVKTALQKFFSSPEWVFAVLAGIFGLMSVFTTPLQMTPDEPSHFQRAYQLSELRLFPDGEIESSRHGVIVSAYYLPTNITEFNQEYGNFDVVFSRHTAAYLFADDTDKDIFTKKVDFDDRSLAIISTAAGYFPIAHLPQAVGIAIGRLIYPSIGVMYLSGRLFNLIFYVLVIFLIIKKARRAKWAYAVIALFPMLICHAASFSADPIAAVGIFGLFMVIHNLFTQKETMSKKDMAWLAIFALVATFIRPTNIVLLLPLLFLPQKLFIKNRLKKIPFSINKWATVISIGITVLIIVVAWQYIAAKISAPSTQPGVDAMAQIKEIIANPFHYMGAMFRTFFPYNPESGSFVFFRYIYESPGAITWLYIPLPGTVLVIQYITLLFAFLYGKRNDTASGKEAAVSVATYVAISLATASALYIMWSRVGASAVDGLQDRYFSPMFIILVPLFLWFKKYIYVSARHKQTIGLIVAFTATLSLSTYIIQVVRMYAG